MSETMAMGASLLLSLLLCGQLPDAGPALAKNHLLHEAAAAGDVALVTKLLNDGANPNVPTTVKILMTDVKPPWTGAFNGYLEPGATPLHVAVVMKKTDVIKVLLKHKAKANPANKSGQTPLNLAVMRGDLDVVKTLLENGARLKDEEGLFVEAVSYGWLDIGRYLLDKGANINEPGFAGMTGLLWAISRGDAPSVTWLLDKGADINLAAKTKNKPGAWTPLTLAVYNERANMVELLLKRGADPTIADNVGHPIQQAVEKKNLKIVGQLARACGKKFLDDQRILHKTIFDGYYESAPVLIAAGADVNLKDAKGMTPLHLVSQRGNPELLSLLLKHKADIEARDDQGRTPLFFAVVTAAKVSSTTSTLLPFGPGPVIPDGKPLLPLPPKDSMPIKKGFVSPEGKYSDAALAQLKQMLKAGAKVNVADKKGLTPLHYAALIEDEMTFQKLTGLTAHPTTYTFHGNATSWTATTRFNGFTAAQMLLLRGADAHAKTQAGKTPLELCTNSKTRELLQLAMDLQK